MNTRNPLDASRISSDFGRVMVVATEEGEESIVMGRVWEIRVRRRVGSYAGAGAGIGVGLDVIAIAAVAYWGKSFAIH